jgi:molybdopterin-guanine dinucleotide biosynthesis protein MobB
MVPAATPPVRTGVLLAGGSSRRAGVDKRYLVLGGQTLLRRNLEFLRGLFPTVVVSVGPGQTVDLGDAAPVDVVADLWPGASPLAGIATVLEHYRRPLFVMAADIAFPDAAAARAVLAAFAGADAALPRIGPYRQPLFAAYGLRCLPPMRQLLQDGRHRIVDALAGLAVAEVPFPDEAAFHNINTMSAYETAREQAGGTEGSPALVAIVGKSDSGKTTFIELLLPELIALGLRVGTVKHHAHAADIDHEGKDSWRHGRAGAAAYVVSSPSHLAYVAKTDEEVPLATIARRFFEDFDLVVAEGYKASAPHRVELYRVGAGHASPLCGPGEAMALVTDAPLDHEHRFALGDARGVARFLAARLDSLREY